MLISYWRKYEEDLCIFAKSEEKLKYFYLFLCWSLILALLLTCSIVLS